MRSWRCLLLTLTLCFCSLGVRAGSLLLDDRVNRVDTWSALTVLPEKDGPMDLAQARAQAPRFLAPTGARGSLGLSKVGVWLRLPLQVAPDSDGRWVLDIDYPPLNRVDIHLVAGDRVLESATLGNLQPFTHRALASRSIAMPLALAPGQAAEIWLRVQTQGGLVLPISLSKPADFHARGMREQLLQGVLGGLGLCLVIYSLMQWVVLREHLFGKYALLTTASVLFSAFQFGIGAQLLWPDQPWIERHAGSFFALLASAGSSLFIEHALRPHAWRLFGVLMKAVAAALLVSAVAHALDLIDAHQVSAIVGTLGLAPALLGLPGALVLARRGDGIGWALLAAWLAYFFTTAVMVGLIRGRVDADAWTLHSFQFGATLDMVLFMRVIGLRLRAVQLVAERASRERDALLSMAHADPLTGLANRRGLKSAMDRALPRVTPQRQMALFMLDLDGFKAVNDRHGHEAGDELLVAVARRLQANVRSGEDDIVARLGGDEFVIVVCGLRAETQALEVAEHLRRSFEAAFLLAGGANCRLGMTIGFALAPADGTDAATLLKRADAAMYRGKQAGGSGLQRWPGSDESA